MTTAETRHCTRCNYSLYEYAPTETLCGACTNSLFEEPEQCVECNSDESMELKKVSLDGKDGISAWVCNDCGHAHLNPDHLEEDCMGC